MVRPRTLFLIAAALTGSAGALSGADRLRAGEGEARAGAKGVEIPLGIAHDHPIRNVFTVLGASIAPALACPCGALPPPVKNPPAINFFSSRKGWTYL
jgi:hypothetical protein